MYCPKFLSRISYNNFSGERVNDVGVCTGRRLTEKQGALQFHCYWLIFLSKSFGICYILLHFLKHI